MYVTYLTLTRVERIQELRGIWTCTDTPLEIEPEGLIIYPTESVWMVPGTMED